MSRPVYYFDSANVDYTFIQKGGVAELCVLEFRASGKEIGTLKKPRCLLSGTSGILQFNVQKVTVIPGPPVNGRLAVRVDAMRTV